MKRNRIIILIAAAISIFACNNNRKDAVPGASGSTVAVSGEQLFKINCTQCHRPAEELSGPALKNVASRWENKALLYEFIKNPQAVIVKDPYAKALFAKWKQAYMQPFPGLSDDDIDSILSYCNAAPQ